MRIKSENLITSHLSPLCSPTSISTPYARSMKYKMTIFWLMALTFWWTVINSDQRLLQYNHNQHLHTSKSSWCVTSKILPSPMLYAFVFFCLWTPMLLPWWSIILVFSIYNSFFPFWSNIPKDPITHMHRPRRKEKNAIV